MSKLILIIVILVLVLVIIGIIYYAYRTITAKIRSLSRIAFGTDNPIEGLKKVDEAAAVTPKSVSAATSLYMPQIMRDFPEFHLDEMKTRAENVLTSYLECVDRDNETLLRDGSDELRNKLELRLQGLRAHNQREHYSNIRVHRTEIREYRKDKGRVSVIFESAVQYHYYREQNGKVTQGNPNGLYQSKYDIEMMYIQDQTQIEQLGDAGKALTCPNCGAPLPHLGAKKCLYCGSPVIEFNIRVWNFVDVKEVRN